MGISERPIRPMVLLWLAGFVVVFAGVSWFVTGAIGLHAAPPTHSHPLGVTPGPTPTPLDCPSSEIELFGVFNECAKAAPDATSTCSVSGHILEAVLRLAGSDQAFLLYIELDGAYAGPGKYDLPPWPHGLGTKDDVPKVAVRQYTTGAFWQSVAGVLTVTGSDGRSGIVSAVLEASIGNNSVVPGPPLSVAGRWSCT
jgi:hypothetical protein